MSLGKLLFKYVGGERVYISSSFKDIQEEREILIKETFLQLRKLFKDRDIEITEIDLRTGIIEEELGSENFIKYILDELEKCKKSPIFFIGILGNYYGWDEWYSSINNSAFLEDKKYSWIKEHTDVSITELEIISAIERNKTHNKAFFYLKENLKDEDIKLIDLKNRLIEKSTTDDNLYVTNYKDNAEFREKTIDSFTNALDELYPKDEKLSELEKIRTTHKIFAKSKQKFYISNQRNKSILSNFIASDQDRLLLYGKSGYGKSALIANYFHRLKEEKSHFIIEHYIDAGGESSDFYQMLKRVIKEIKEKFKLHEELPNEPKNIIDEFALWLHRVKRPTIIVFDGYNQIEDEMKEKLFYYIPDKLESVKLIITSIKDNYPINNKYKIEPLNQNEKSELITGYLQIYGKTLNETIKEQIVRHPLTDNQLFLKILLDEIRLISYFEIFEQKIEYYLQSKDITELFSKILERLEDDYDENLVKEILSLIYSSKDGLSENNLIEAIEVQRLEFSPIFLAIEEYLIDKNGLYSFSNDYIREAVRYRYMNNNYQNEKIILKFKNEIQDRVYNETTLREIPKALMSLDRVDELVIYLRDIVDYLFKYLNEKYEITGRISNTEIYKEITDVEFIIETINLLPFEVGNKYFKKQFLNKLNTYAHEPITSARYDETPFLHSFKLISLLLPKYNTWLFEYLKLNKQFFLGYFSSGASLEFDYTGRMKVRIFIEIIKDLVKTELKIKEFPFWIFDFLEQFKKLSYDTCIAVIEGMIPWEWYYMIDYNNLDNELMMKEVLDMNVPLDKKEEYSKWINW